MGYVYFIGDGEAIKIGYSYDPLKRLIQLQTGHPRPLRILGVLIAVKEDEARLQYRFRHLLLRKEWFQAEPDLLQFVASLPRIDLTRAQPSFIEWFDRHQEAGWPSEVAEREAFFVKGYLDMHEHRPLPRCLYHNLAEHVAKLESAMR